MKNIFIRLGAIFLCLILISTIMIGFTGCDDDLFSKPSDKAQKKTANQNGEAYELSFIAEFYDNTGNKWLTTKGSKFDISPNKVKEYSYDSDGSWISKWTMSSIMSVNIDDNDIETCGSTVIIYDNYLVKQECVLPSDSTDTSNDKEEASISSPPEIRLRDAWTVDWWWKNKDTKNYKVGKKIILIQSQEGNPICLFSGNSVSWEVSRNLPKTTEITIDDAKLYIHRANFAVIDKSIFNKKK